MSLTAGALAELFREMAFISAIIDGFAFTFLGVMVTTTGRSRFVDALAALAALGTAGLLVCTLGWTMAAAHTALLGAPQIPPDLLALHRALSFVFMGCLLLFLATIGMSGWLRSRLLGAVTTGAALAAAAGGAALLRMFVR